jgi:glycosyltransferase involved in cell wall biosynthesis
MATYNGARFIDMQLDSILEQLGSNDEVIIVDDNSKDDTVLKIRQRNDSRILLTVLPKNGGHVNAFSLALSQIRGDIVFLSDQDDYWSTSRVAMMIDALTRQKALLVNSSYGIVNEQGSAEISSVVHVGKSGRASNIWNIIMGKYPYYGNTFCLSGEFIKRVVPIPEWVEAHDLYLGLMANMTGPVVHLNEMTVLRTVHDNNLTVKTKRKFLDILKTRIIMLRIIGKAVFTSMT